MAYLIWRVLGIFSYFLIAIYLSFLFLLKKVSSKEIKERLGFLKLPKSTSIDESEIIWVHLSSYGELLTAAPFLMQYQKAYGVKYVLTFFNAEILPQLPKFDLFVASYFLPFENPLAFFAIIKHWSVKHVFLFETEIWPNLLLTLKAKNVSVTLINGSLYEKNFSAYEKFRFLFRPLWFCYSHLYLQSEEDQIRYLKLGIPQNKITVSGDLKCDRPLPELMPAQARLELKRQLQFTDTTAKILTLGSVHPDEDAILVKLISNLLNYPKLVFPLNIVIAPRHLSRVPQLKKILTKFDLPYRLRTSVESKTNDRIFPSILILDTLGELRDVYQISDLIFVGGSLIPHGGHNLIEAVALEKIALTGPYTFHFNAMRKHLDPWIHEVNEENFVEGVIKLIQTESTSHSKSARDFIQERLMGTSTKLVAVIGRP